MATGNTLEQESIVFIELDELDRQLNELKTISEVLESRLSRVIKIITDQNVTAKIGIPDSHSIGSSELAIRISAQSISIAKITDLLSSIMYRLEV